jgi:hypothetical protein
LIHRDVKPANLWLEPRPQQPGGPPAPCRVKILDFGLARPAGGAEPLTHSGAIVGTPAYMAPEQARGAAVDGRCDLFSLGCVLYRMCTGQAPFKASDPVSTLLAVATEQPRPPHELNPDVPEPVSDLILALLAKEPADRPAAAPAVALALAALECGQTIGRPTGTPLPRARGRKSLFVNPFIPLTAVLLMVVAGAVLWFRTDRQAGPAEPAFVPLDESWVRKVQSLPAQEQVDEVGAELKRRNPGFDGTLHPGVEGQWVTALICKADEVEDLAPVRVLTGLKTLVCGGNYPGRGKLANLAPLQGMGLTHLDVGSSQVSSLAPLRGMKLRTLVCGHTPVADLAPLEGMPLTRLICDDTPVADLAPLKGMPLAVLNCTGTRVASLAPLEGMRDLRTLSCESTQVADLSPLKGIPLTSLNCIRARVTDLSVVKGMPLEILFCDFMPRRDTDLLRSLQSLQNVNGKPLARFWKDAGIDPAVGKP